MRSGSDPDFYTFWQVLWIQIIDPFFAFYPRIYHQIFNDENFKKQQLTKLQEFYSEYNLKFLIDLHEWRQNFRLSAKEIHLLKHIEYLSVLSAGNYTVFCGRFRKIIAR